MSVGENLLKKLEAVSTTGRGFLFGRVRIGIVELVNKMYDRNVITNSVNQLR